MNSSSPLPSRSMAFCGSQRSKPRRIRRMRGRVKTPTRSDTWPKTKMTPKRIMKMVNKRIPGVGLTCRSPYPTVLIVTNMK